MKIEKAASLKIGLLISIAIAVMINFYQIMIYLFDLKPPFAMKPDMPSQLPDLGVDLLVNMLYCFTLTIVLYLVNNRLLESYRSRCKFLVILSVSAITMILVLFVFSYGYLYLYMSEVTPEMEWMVKMHFRGKGSLILFLVIGITHTVHLYKQYEDQKVEVERLSAENIRSQYIALKNQIDPHFLFNSLNTLNGLISMDPTKAQEYIQQLSSIFRYSMQDRDIVRVADELSFAQAFGILVQIRYADALVINYNIADRCLHKSLIPFSIQTLIENAIKHNTITELKPLTINIYSDPTESHIVVDNLIQPKRDKEKGEGIGLANLSKRYELLHNNRIEIRQHNGLFSVSIPIIDSI